MFRFFLVLMTVIAGFLFGFQLSFAQEVSEETPPIQFLARVADEFSLFVWNPDTGESREIPNLRYSPSGEWGIYSELAPISQEFLESNDNLGGLPNDLWLVNVETGEEELIAAQLDDAMLSDEAWENLLRRAYVSWSPDGSQVAWSELLTMGNEQYQFRIMVMELATRQVRTLVNHIPEHIGTISPQPIDWVQSGIVLQIRLASTQQDSFILYDPVTGELLQTLSLPEGDNYASSLMFEQGNRSQVLVLNSADDFFYMDLESGEQFSLLGSIFTLPYAVSTENPLGSIRVQLILSGDYSFPYQWQISTPDGETYVTSTMSNHFLHTRDFAISPDGQSVIFRPDYEVHTPSNEEYFLLWHNGEIQQVPFMAEGQVGDIINQVPTWGDIRFLLRTHNEFSCDDAPEPHLIIGGEATVLPGDPNTLRWYPSTDAARIGSIAAGEIFTVLDGPACSYGYNWWLVDYGGEIGWTAEGTGDTYWLETLGE